MRIINEEFESKYNNNYEEIYSEWNLFNNLKNNNDYNKEDKVNSYYISDFRKHCHNHRGLAIHKCENDEKGKFIKIYKRFNFRFRKNKKAKYIICEGCKKVFYKDIFHSYCSYCNENYLSSILHPNENKECFVAAYSENHCETLANEAIPCKLCKEKLFLFIKGNQLKCLKCSYIIDLNSKNEFKWQCAKCNNYFKSNVKIFNYSENLIAQNIIKKALLFKIKAHPNNMNCCNIDINNYTFLHKNECNGILYLCNVEKYYPKNKNG